METKELENINTLETTAKPTQFATKPESTVFEFWAAITFHLEVKRQPPSQRRLKSKNTTTNITTILNWIRLLSILLIPLIIQKNCWLEIWPVTLLELFCPLRPLQPRQGLQMNLQPRLHSEFSPMDKSNLKGFQRDSILLSNLTKRKINLFIAKPF